MAAVECAKPQLLLFEPKPIQYSVLKTEQVALKPLAALENCSTIQFSDSGYGDDYRNLGNMYLLLKVKMIYKDTSGSLVTDTPTNTTRLAYPVNNFLHSLFRQVILTLNGKQVAQNSQNYAYRAYLENLLNFQSQPVNTYKVLYGIWIHLNSNLVYIG